MFISNDSNNTITVNSDNAVLSPSSNIKILGVTIDERITFKDNINIICQNAARQLNAIKCLQCNLQGFYSNFYIRDLFEQNDQIYNLHSTVSRKQLKCNTVTYGSNSFLYKDGQICNDLPNKI